jgi:hypothetical protein
MLLFFPAQASMVLSIHDYGRNTLIDVACCGRAFIDPEVDPVQF